MYVLELFGVCVFLALMCYIFMRAVVVVIYGLFCVVLVVVGLQPNPYPTQPDPTQPSPAQPDPTQPNPTQLNPVQSNPIQPSPIQPNPMAFYEKTKYVNL